MVDDEDMNYYELSSEVPPEDEAAEQPEMPELPAPVDWMSLSVREWPDELGRLRLWVGQIVTDWALPSKIVPPCWEQHASMVQLLGALRDAYDTLYHEMQPGTGSVDWQRYWSWARSELASIAAGQRCTATEHFPDRIQEWARALTEDGETSDVYIAEDERVRMMVDNHIARGTHRDGMGVVFVDFMRGEGR